MIYIIVAFCIFLLHLKYESSSHYKRVNTIWYYILLLILISIPAFRYRVGGDTIIYMDEYDTMPFLKDVISYIRIDSSRYQPLWLFFVASLRSISSDFVLFQIVHAVIVNSIFFCVFKKYCNNVFFALFLYFLHGFFVFNFEVLREAFAVCIFMLSWPLCNKKQWGKYMLCAVSAFLIHDAAFLLFLVPLVYGRHVNFLRLVLLSGLMGMIAPSLLHVMSSIGVGQMLVERGALYMSNLLSFNLNWVIFHACTKLVIPYCIFYAAKRNGIRTKVDNFAMFYFLCVIISVFIPPLVRLYNYVIPISIVYLCGFLDCVKNKATHNRLYGIRNTISILVICFVLWFRVVPYFRNTSHIVPNSYAYNLYYPYSSIFDPHVYVIREEFNIATRNN